MRGGGVGGVVAEGCGQEGQEEESGVHDVLVFWMGLWDRLLIAMSWDF